MKIIRGSLLEFLPASHEDPRQPGVLKKVLATRDDLLSGQVQMVNWSEMPVGSEFQRHYHEDMQEVFVLISGQAEMQVGDQFAALTAGDAILVEPREIHCMKNTGNQPVRYLVFGISTGAGGQTIVVPSAE